MRDPGARTRRLPVIGRVGGPHAASTAAVCVSVFLSLLAWALITPPFQAPDEPTHLAYVQRLAETGRAPSPEEVDRPPLSSELAAGLDATGFSGIIGDPTARSPSTAAAERRAERLLTDTAPQDDGGGATAYATYPPLYYALGAVPYLLADWAGATILGKLTGVRLLSCVLSTLTVLFVVLFLREAFPRSGRAWVPAALSVGLLPYFGFIGSSINSDVLLAAVSAGLLAALARAFRRGLTTKRAVLIGAVVALGVLTKPAFYGLIPGVAIAMLVLAARRWPESPGAVVRALAGFAGAAVVPVVLYVALSVGVWDRPLSPSGGVALTGTEQDPTARERSLRGLLSYAWQFWLPRPWFLTNQVGPDYPLWETMFKGFFGRFGWLDYQLPAWAYSTVLVIWGVLLALVVRALVIGRTALRTRAGELLSYGVMVLGLMVVIAVPAYNYRLDTGFPFEQGRYLFPLLGLYAALVVLALRGIGERLAPYLAVGVVVATGALDVGGLLLTVGRYYG